MCKKKFSLILAIILPFFIMAMSACTITFAPDKITPQIEIETDNRLQYSSQRDEYNLLLNAGEVYEIIADLGEYDGDQYYIEFALAEETLLITLESNKITVSGTLETDGRVVVFAILKKVGQEEGISKVKIVVDLLIEPITE